MSRTGIPTIGPSDAGPCIDIFALWAGYACQTAVGPEGNVRHLHILVDLTRTKDAWCCTHELSGKAPDAVEFCANGLDIGAACHFLTYLWSQTSPSEVHVVLGLPRFGQRASACVWQLLDALRHLQGDAPLACVGVAEQTLAWGDSSSLAHFVGVPPPFHLRPSLLGVFGIFATLTAPEAYVELDAADVLEFMGTAERPAHIVEVSWHMPGWESSHGFNSPDPVPEPGSMGAVNPHEDKVLLSAGAALACPLWSAFKQRLLIGAVLSELAPFVPYYTPITVVATGGLWGRQAAPLDVGTLAVLCKPYCGTNSSSHRGSDGQAGGESA